VKQCKWGHDLTYKNLIFRKSGNRKPECRECRKGYKKKYRLINVLYLIRHRCENPKDKNFRTYGGRGIGCFLTVEDIKKLWSRDGAGGMESPTIDRIDNDGDYTFNNCRYLERSKNTSLARRGELNRSAKLKERDVIDIRRHRKKGVSALLLSKHYGITPSAINAAARGKTWRHLLLEPAPQASTAGGGE